ncbi:MAG TPA: pilus assembly protein [Xanthobacteraceae bacterium]|jgi:Flp pilus assembly protein TadG
MLFQRFLDDRSGSVMPLLALAAIPVVGLIGASIDYSRAAAIQTTMQAAADSTSLAMYKEAAKLNATQLQTEAQAYFNAMFVNTGAAPPTVNVSYTNTAGSQVVITANSSVNTLFMGLMGFSQLPISATSTAVWGNTRLRVALVLDNTGSMSQGGSGTASSPNKIQALQTASHSLLQQLQTAATNEGDVYVSIVPFAKDVNVGKTNYSQPWVDFTDWDAANGTCSKSRQSTQASCTANGGKWKSADHSTWNGCVTDRDQNYDTTNATPTSGGTLFPAEQYDACPTAIVPLTYDWTALGAAIDAMTPNGGTNQAIGAAWGWQSLTQTSPLSAPSEDPNYRYQHIVIILSDGLNTQDRWYGNGSTPSSQVDGRQRIACDNMKNAGVTIYAVQVNTDNEATSSVLQYCAGSKAGAADPTKFFLLTAPKQIVTTFNQIGTQLSKLRISN